SLRMVPNNLVEPIGSSGRMIGPSMDRIKDLRRLLIICATLFVLTLATFWPALHNGFINFDDPEYILENPHVSQLTWANVVWAFGTGYGGNWHPLTWLSHMLDGQLYGLQAGGHHLTSVLMHAVNGVFLFLLLRRMTGATWRSALVAALFALHPLRVESVAWASDRKDVLSGLFFMLTLWAHTRYVETTSAASTQPAQRLQWKPRVAWYLLALLLFACGLMSKPMLVTLPFLLFLLDYWPFERLRLTPRLQMNAGQSPRRVEFHLAEKFPFFVMTILASLVTVLV